MFFGVFYHPHSAKTCPYSATDWLWPLIVHKEGYHNSSPKVKPKCLNHPLVTGCSTVINPVFFRMIIFVIIDSSYRVDFCPCAHFYDKFAFNLLFDDIKKGDVASWFTAGTATLKPPSDGRTEVRPAHKVSASDPDIFILTQLFFSSCQNFINLTNKN